MCSLPNRFSRLVSPPAPPSGMDPLRSSSDIILGPTAPNARVYVDALGARWQVFERAGLKGVPMLVFESASGFRCVRGYPADWRSLTDQGLADLSWRT